MDDSHILIHQKSAEVINMMLGSVVTMLPFVTYGTLSAYLTIGNYNLYATSIPSYALLSEICLIRYRSSLASINTLHGNIGWLISERGYFEAILQIHFDRSLLWFSGSC